MSRFPILAASAFASAFSLRLIDPLILPVAADFGVSPAAAAVLSPAYALPYAIAQPFLGPLGDRIGRERGVAICIAGLIATLIVSATAADFETLLWSRVAAGVIAGGIIPFVLAAIGDAYGMAQRRVVIGRMLLAIIGGQMMGSFVGGISARAFGWRSAFVASACIAAAAAGCMAWHSIRKPRAAPLDEAGPADSFRALYGFVFANPASVTLFTCVLLEGTLFFGLFPYVGEIMKRQAHALQDVSDKVGIVLGAFGAGGLVFAIAVPVLVRRFPAATICGMASVLAAAAYAGLLLSTFWWQLAAAMFACGLAFFMIHNTLQAAATELAPRARGSALALFASALFLGQGVGPLVFGPLLDHAGLTVTLLVTAGAVVALGQVVARRVAV